MNEAYGLLTRAVNEAGFFTNGIEDHGTWHRTCVCSKRCPDGSLTGNSFWVSRVCSKWYLGTWDGSIYLLPEEDRLLELCISSLSRARDGTRYDFDDRLKREFQLLPVADETFETENAA